VLWITLDSPHYVVVDRMFCKSCKAVYHIRPVDVNCLPGTPVYDWDLTRPEGTQTIWWDMKLLQQFDSMSLHVRRVGETGFCHSLVDNWERSGCNSLNISVYTLRTSFSSVIQEFQILEDGKLDLPGKVTEEWAPEPENGCAACGFLIPARTQPVPAATESGSRSAAAPGLLHGWC
jgi:hypothetical protein